MRELPSLNDVLEVRGGRRLLADGAYHCVGISPARWRISEPRKVIVMIDAAEKRGQVIKHLEEALALADDIEGGNTGFLIERALDEARSQQFRLAHR